MSSVISADKLLEDIQPWEPDSWKRFLENYLLPLKSLAEEYVKRISTDTSAQDVQALAEATNKVLRIAEAQNIKPTKTYSIPPNTIDIARELIWYAANIFPSIGEGGKYTLIAWLLRKFFMGQMLETFKNLKKDEKLRNKVFSVLSVKRLMEFDLPEDLKFDTTLYGYEDYLWYCKPLFVSSETSKIGIPIERKEVTSLGASICYLIDCTARLLERRGFLKYFVPEVDPVQAYLRTTDNILQSHGIRYSTEYYVVRSESWGNSLQSLVDVDYFPVVTGTEIKIYDRVTAQGFRSEFESCSKLLFDYINEYGLPVMLGRLELLSTRHRYSGEHVMFLIERTSQ